MEADIEYREWGNEKWTLWAIREGTREEIIETAEDLLRGLRDEFPAAKVRAVLQNNHIINARYKRKKSKLKKKLEDEKIETPKEKIEPKVETPKEKVEPKVETPKIEKPKEISKKKAKPKESTDDEEGFL